MPDTKSSASRHVFLLVLVLLVGAALRLHDLAGPELQWDEFLALHRASMPVGQLLESLNAQSASDVSQDTSPPLHHLIIHFANRLSGSDFMARLPGALFGVLSLLMLYFVGKAFIDERSGLCAALYGALLQFHLFYSRYMRWYVFFYVFALLSLLCFKRLVDRPSGRTVVAYGLATAAMLYSSYIAAPFVLAQMLFTAGLALALWRSPETRRDAWRVSRTHFLGLALAGVLYLPQLQGQLVAFHTFYREGGHPVDYYRIGKALREMTIYFRDSDFTGTGLILLLMGCGITRMYWTRPKRDFWLILLFCLVPTAAAFGINVQTQITAKYLVGWLFAILIFTGVGAVHVADSLVGLLLPKGSRRTGGLATAAALALVIFASGANLDYGPFYRGWGLTYSDWSRHLLAARQDADWLMLEKNRGKKVILRHEVGNAFRFFENVFDHGYKRFHFVSHKGGQQPPGLMPTFTKPQPDETLLFARGGVASRAPIQVMPGEDGRFIFTDNFETLAFYETIYEACNVAPDFSGRTLSRFNLDDPGYALWKLVQPAGGGFRTLRVSLEAWLHNKIRNETPDARLVVSAGQDPASLRPLTTIDLAAFAAKAPELAVPFSTGSFDLPVNLEVPWADPGAPMFVRLDLLGGRHVAFVDISSIRFEASCQPGEPFVDAALAVLGNIEANARVIPWSEGQTILGDTALHVFAFNDARYPPPGPNASTTWQSAAALARFTAAHPGLAPVTIVSDAANQPAFAVYDPRLARSELELPAGRQCLVAWQGETPQSFGGLSYVGPTMRPTLRLGEQTIAIPLSVPAGAEVRLNPGGLGMVSFSPLFTDNAFNLFNMVGRENLFYRDNSLSCLEDKPCLAQYVFASELPIKGLRATLYPEVKNDRPNHVRVFYGVNDIDARNVLIDFSERNTQDVSSTYEGLTRETRFDRGVKVLFVGLDLSGRGARAHSDEKYTMRFEVLLDASSLPSPTIEQSPVAVSQDSESKETMSLWLDTRPIPIEQLWKLR